MAGPWFSTSTTSPSHQVKLLIFLALVIFFKKIWIGLFINFRSCPPRFSQQLLASDQLWAPPTNSKQTFLKANSQSAGTPLPGQASDFSGKKRNPAEINKKTAARSNMSTVIIIIMCRAKAHSAAGVVVGAATGQDYFRLPHGNQGGFSRKTLHVLSIHYENHCRHSNKMQREKESLGIITKGHTR